MSRDATPRREQQAVYPGVEASRTFDHGATVTFCDGADAESLLTNFNQDHAMTDASSLRRLAEYNKQAHDRENHLHMARDHLLHACSVHGLAVDELHGLLSAIHTCVAPSQGIDAEMENLLDVCDQLEGQLWSAS